MEVRVARLILAQRAKPGDDRHDPIRPEPKSR